MSVKHELSIKFTRILMMDVEAYYYPTSMVLFVITVIGSTM